MGAAQAMETAGAQAPGTEASTEQERTWLAKRLGDKTEAHLEGHTQYARGFLPYPWNSGKSPGLRFPMCHSGCFGKNSFQGDMEAGHQLDDHYRSAGKQGPQLDKGGRQIQRDIGLAKKFILFFFFFFCIRCYGKVPTNFLANPILRR